MSLLSWALSGPGEGTTGKFSSLALTGPKFEVSSCPWGQSVASDVEEEWSVMSPKTRQIGTPEYHHEIGVLKSSHPSHGVLHSILTSVVPLGRFRDDFLTERGQFDYVPEPCRAYREHLLEGLLGWNPRGATAGCCVNFDGSRRNLPDQASLL